MRRRSIWARAGSSVLALILGATLVAACGSSTSAPSKSGGSGSPTGSDEVTPSDSPFAVATPASPPEGWKRRTVTELGFAFDYPPEWVGGKLGAQTTLTSADAKANIFWVSNDAPAGGNLDGYKLVNIASLKAEPEWQGPVSIGGIAGWGYEIHLTVASLGKDYFAIDYFTVYAGRSYDFIWMSTPGTETADRALYKQIESTFAFSQ
jgi:hypothetical protein